MGPKGATIKRIQQQTRTYIVTPSRDKEPVFEVTGLPENVETARKEIEAHIAFRTQQQAAGVTGDPPVSGFYGDLDDISSFGGSHSSNSCSTGCSNPLNPKYRKFGPNTATNLDTLSGNISLEQ